MKYKIAVISLTAIIFYIIINMSCAHSLVDKTLASGAEDAGSIPVGRTTIYMKF